jgi:3D (Asp-Asp-Asp) domain-containing protein
MNKRTVRLLGSIVVLGLGVVFFNSAMAATFTAKSTSYYPHNSKREGGYVDRRDTQLYTLQAYLRGEAPYVSVAMDVNAFKYGTKVRIPEIDKHYGKKIEFRIVDTGGDFVGKGRSRIDICTENYRSTLHPLVNGRLTVTTDGVAAVQRPQRTTAHANRPVPVAGRISKPSVSKPTAPALTPVVSSNLRGLIRESLLENREVLNANPSDMVKLCPQYYSFNQQERADVWTELMLSMVHNSSNMNSRKARTESISDSSGNLVISRGLLQISAESARGYRCEFSQNSDLHNDATNIKCGLKMIQRLLGRDDKIGIDAGDRKGLARYWGSFRETRTISKMRSQVSKVSACIGPNRVASIGVLPSGLQ